MSTNKKLIAEARGNTNGYSQTELRCLGRQLTEALEEAEKDNRRVEIAVLERLSKKYAEFSQGDAGLTRMALQTCSTLLAEEAQILRKHGLTPEPAPATVEETPSEGHEMNYLEMPMRYRDLLDAAGETWSGSDLEDIKENGEYLKSQVDLLAEAFGRDRDEVREDILDAGDISRPLKWDGRRKVVITDGYPWIQDEDEELYSFGGGFFDFRLLTPEIEVLNTSIRDASPTRTPQTDLHAARVAAEMVTVVTGESYDVWFTGFHILDDDFLEG